MIEHWQAIAAGILFCLPACVVVAVWYWLDTRGRRK